MDVKARLGRNLRKHRKALDLSQEAFADLVGIHRTYASDMERGKRNPTIMVVEKVAEALGCSLGDLLD